MNTRALAGLALALLPAAAAPPGILEAGIRQGALLAGPLGTPPAVVVAGGAGRALPAFSPDARRVAFVQATDRHRALADVVVVDRAGHELSRTAIEPVEPGTAYAGMRYVEALRWIGPDRILIRGSINPSQSQYYEIDAAAGRVVADVIDDESAAAVSPDGRRIATLSGSPHFTPEAEQRPVLSIDGTPVWHGAAGTVLAAPPRFSPDGTALAWAARDGTGRTMLLIWNGTALRRIAVPAPAGATLALRWPASGLTLTTTDAGHARAWALRGAALAPSLARTEEAVALRERLARAAGLTEPDFWCADCALRELPRGTE